MARGSKVELGVVFWPNKDETQEGEEIVGVYKGLVDGEYKGKPKPSAVFVGEKDTYQISSGTMTKVIAPKLTVGQKYYVVYVGKKDTGQGNAAYQFEVYEDDGAGS